VEIHGRQQQSLTIGAHTCLLPARVTRQDARPLYYQYSSADSSELDITRQRNISPASYSANTVTRVIGHSARSTRRLSFSSTSGAVLHFQSALDLRMTRSILSILSKRGAYVAFAAIMRTRQRRPAPDNLSFEAYYLCYYMSVGGIWE
jgi:hypothetical protein